MTDRMKLVILAGGKGTRLQSVLVDKPKPLATLGGRSLLMRQIDLAVAQGVDEVHLMVHHMADQIREHIGDGSSWGISIQYHAEVEPRGTAGCVLEHLSNLPDRFLTFYGDTLINVDVDRMWKYHADRAADVTLLVHPNSHPYDSDLIELDSNDHVTAFHHVPHCPNRFHANLVNAALYVIEKSAISAWQSNPSKMDFARDLFPLMLGNEANIIGYRSREYIKDMGTPERLMQGEEDLSSGKVERLSIANRASAVFLDRDGTLNVEANWIKDPNELILIEGSAEACKQINQQGMLAVVVTNQAVVARGDCTIDGLKQIHNKLESLLGQEGAYVDAIYYCPHHPHSGFEGEVPELKICCDCRKPETGMLTRAAHDLNIDISNSWMVGDTTSDIAAGQSAGARTVLVRTGHAGRDYKYPVKAQYEFFDLAEATRFMLQDHDRLTALAESTVDIRQGRVIAIGGRSRSGKSTWASICRERIEQTGRRAHVISMDGWIKSERDRGTNVNERFNVSGFVDTIKYLIDAREQTRLRLPIYDRVERRVLHDKGPELTIDPEDLLILEGVILLDVQEFRDVATQSFFISCNEDTYQMRFRREYFSRGYNEQQISQLFQQRQVDEIPIVDQSRNFADHVINLDQILARMSAGHSH